MCTGISLTATGGSIIVGRAVEWALSDAHHDRLIVVPLHTEFTVPDYCSTAQLELADRCNTAHRGTGGFR